MSAFPHLFQPTQLRGREIANRLFFPAHGTSLGEGGRVSERLIAYHEARAAGGVGMIVTEGMSMHPSFDIAAGYLLAGAPESVPGFAALAAAVQRHGCRILGQLFHPGPAMRTTPDGARRPLYSASELPLERYGAVPIAASPAWLGELAGAYGRAAGHLMEAGFDGVEILAGMGYLVAQFLNPRTNLRTDRYGGSLENRMRLLAEILAAVRRAAGGAAILGVRIGGGGSTQDALAPGETLEICRALEAGGLADYINVIGGNTATARGWIEVFPPMSVPPGHVVPAAAALKRELTLPVLVAGRINQPQLAEAVLARGEADMVGAARALIADPFFAAKARQGRADDIRACIACNQACVGHRLQYFPVSCIQHPESGRELAWPHVKPAAARQRMVVVAGGGPAGMKAAAVAAERGHRVALYEREGRLGGQALLAAALPGRAEFGGMIANLERELALAGVRVERNACLTAQTVRALRPDVVVVATGALPRRPRFEGEAHAVDAWAVVRGEANVGASVLIADARNDWTGPGVAEKLAREGCRVRLAVTGIVPGQNLQDGVRDHWIGELHRLGVETIPYARLFGADGDSVYLQHTVTDEAILCEGVDTLVLAQGAASRRELAEALADWEGEVHPVGDALMPRSAEEAVLEGLQAAMLI